jgi:hypothetical protein
VKNTKLIRQFQAALLASSPGITAAFFWDFSSDNLRNLYSLYGAVYRIFFLVFIVYFVVTGNKEK